VEDFSNTWSLRSPARRSVISRSDRSLSVDGLLARSVGKPERRVPVKVRVGKGFKLRPRHHSIELAGFLRPGEDDLGICGSDCHVSGKFTALAAGALGLLHDFDDRRSMGRSVG
jgi:hypothetical protein